jgi:hypothetical protein
MEVTARGEDFKIGANARIAVGQIVIRLAVNTDRQLTVVSGILGHGILLFAEKIVASALGVKGGMIEKSAHLGVAAFAGENIQLLFRANKITRKAEKLKEKGTALGVGGIIADFRV